MKYALLSAVLFYIANWTHIRSFTSSLGKKKSYQDIKDPRLLAFIYEKTKLKLVFVRILFSDKPFGMMIGIPGRPIMILSSALYETFSKEEIEYIALHEIGHYKLHHSIKLAIPFLLLLIFGCAVLYFVPNLESAGIILLGIIIGVINIVVGRKMEYEADTFALTHSDDPKAMISATKKFARAYKRPHKLIEFFFYGGVPYEKRIEMAEKELLNRLTN